MTTRMKSTLRMVAVAVLVALTLPLGTVRSAVPFDHSLYLPAVTGPHISTCGSVRVYDYDGIERDWAWLTATFGKVSIEPGDGSACLIELRAKRDDSTLNVRVVDSGGSPVDGIPVVFHWPDADPLPPALVGCYDRGVYGYTGQRIEADPGTIGFGMGGGAFYCPPAGGPHTVWVAVTGSDCVHGLGMLCKTNHYHVNPTFMLTGR